MIPACSAEYDTDEPCEADGEGGSVHFCCLGEGHPLGQVEHVCDCGIGWL